MTTFTEPGKHTLPALPYSYDALEPFIDAKTMELHHNKHHKAYVDGLNAAELALAEARRTDDYKAIAALERAVAFHGSGHANHLLFWNNMTAKNLTKPDPDGKLAEAISREFGSVDKFKAQFSKAAAAVEGNGWGGLIYQPTLNRLYTITILNHQNLSVIGGIPLLLLDVWEHAYYLKYNNRRADYIEAWWNVVNWKTVAERLENAAKLTL